MNRNSILALCLVLLGVLLPPRRALANGGHRRALVVSGGVSLGSYQAGFLYYLVEHLKQSRGPGSAPTLFDVVTGASAGSINAALAAFESCRSPQGKPEESIFFKTWIPVDIDELLPSDFSSITATSLLSRKPLDEVSAVLKAYLEQPAGWVPDRCEVAMGIVATRLNGRTIPLRLDVPSLRTTRMTEKFVMRYVHADGKSRFKHLRDSLGGPPDVDNFLIRPGLNRDAPSFGDLEKLLKASSSFPIAFEPVLLDYQLPGATENAHFIDGGVFENIPVRLADRILKQPPARDSLRTAAPARVAVEGPGGGVAPEQAAGALNDSVLAAVSSVIVVDSDVVTWKPHGQATHDGPLSLLSLVSRFAGEFVKAARAQELLSAIEQDQDLRRHLFMAQRRGMLSSDHLFAFSGFLDVRFRELDFYMGMLDARHFAQDREWADANPGTVTQTDQSIVSPTFACFVKLDDASRGIQETIDRSAAVKLCGASDENGKLMDLIALFDASLQVKKYVQSIAYTGSEQAAFSRYMEILSDQGFKFQIHGNIVEPQALAVWLRTHMGKALSIMANKQPSDRAILDIGAPVALNHALVHAEPESVIGLGVHMNRGMDVEAAFGLGDNTHRVGLAARARSISLLNDDRPVTLSTFASLTYTSAFAHDWPLSDWGLEAGLETGLGYRNTSMGQGAQQAVGAALVATWFQRIYLRLDGQLFSPMTTRWPSDYGSPSLGVGVGWRFHP